MQYSFLKPFRTIFLCIGISALVSCTEEPIEMDPTVIPESVKAQFEELGFDVSDIRMLEVLDLPDPLFESRSYVLEDDIIITQQDLEEMLEQHAQNQVQTKGKDLLNTFRSQYRGKNLVDCVDTIDVVGYTGRTINRGRFGALNDTMKAALTEVIDSCNALNIGLMFNLTFQRNYNSDHEIIIFNRLKSQGNGGSAYLPHSNGKPGRFVFINAPTGNHFTLTKHVLTHEIGHTLGLRHTDSFNRALSCRGRARSERTPAIHIPGTPTGYDSLSVMRSCFGRKDFEVYRGFSEYDRIALEYLYQPPTSPMDQQ